MEHGAHDTLCMLHAFTARKKELCKCGRACIDVSMHLVCKSL